MIRTPYYDLAEKIANGRIDEIDYFCCLYLPIDYVDLFIKAYMEDAINSKIHKHCYEAWMSDENGSNLENNNHRIIALLLLHEMEVNP